MGWWGGWGLFAAAFILCLCPQGDPGHDGAPGAGGERVSGGWSLQRHPGKGPFTGKMGCRVWGEGLGAGGPWGRAPSAPAHGFSLPPAGSSRSTGTQRLPGQEGSPRKCQHLCVGQCGGQSGAGTSSSSSSSSRCTPWGAGSGGGRPATLLAPTLLPLPRVLPGRTVCRDTRDSAASRWVPLPPALPWVGAPGSNPCEPLSLLFCRGFMAKPAPPALRGWWDPR